MRRDKVTLAPTVLCAKKVFRVWEEITEKPVLSVDLVPTKVWTRTVHHVPGENMEQVLQASADGMLEPVGYVQRASELLQGDEFRRFRPHGTA